MTAALAFRATAHRTAHHNSADGAAHRTGGTFDPSGRFGLDGPAEDSFTLEDYVSLFVYDGPARPGILDSDLVTLAP